MFHLLGYLLYIRVAKTKPFLHRHIQEQAVEQFHIEPKPQYQNKRVIGEVEISKTQNGSDRRRAALLLPGGHHRYHKQQRAVGHAFEVYKKFVFLQFPAGVPQCSAQWAVEQWQLDGVDEKRGAEENVEIADVLGDDGAVHRHQQASLQPRQQSQNQSVSDLG